MAQTVKSMYAMRETWVQPLGSGRSPGEGNGNPLQYPCLKNPMDGGGWWATVHGVAKSRTQLSNFTFTFFFSKFNFNFYIKIFNLIFVLQCCVVFCCTTSWISHKCTWFPPSWISLPPMPHPAPCPRLSWSTSLSSLGWVPHIMQQLPTSYLFYTW